MSLLPGVFPISRAFPPIFWKTQTLLKSFQRTRFCSKLVTYWAPNFSFFKAQKKKTLSVRTCTGNTIQSFYFYLRPSSSNTSVRLSLLFHNVPLIVSSWNFQELYYWQKWCPCKRSRSQKSKRILPQFWVFPDCNSSLNPYMTTKWCIKPAVA